MTDPAAVSLELKTDTFSVNVMPGLGGKVSSMRRNGTELLQRPLLPYALRTATMGFEQSDASGFDECVPSVSACEIETPSGTAFIPDHGEFWRLPCTVKSEAPQEIHLSARGAVLPLRFDRKLRLAESAQSKTATLSVEYEVENVGREEIPYAWCAHPLFAVDPGDRILLPSSVTEVMVEGSAGDRLGGNGTVQSWPLARLATGDLVPLDVAGHVSDNIGDKIYAAAPSEGWCAIERRQAGLRVQVEFDPALSPFLGLWLCYGGWPENGARKQYCVALEPCTSPVDSLAAAAKARRAKVLAPGQCDFWWMRIVTAVVS